MILGYFAEVGQPRSSAEVHKELTQRHPEFTSTVAATREALEALVGQGKLERTKQGRSVYYGPVTSTSEEAEGAAAAQEQGTS
ncbi:BlaI/MecI/CopY family transcriptional regulator (plasmid) [Streptomyces sp. S1D4-20]|nr:BlaI/MecI/CopY family transcriptional regulator [Streptomyces sp. S1D4-20]